jgi:hypothetical protein
MKLGTRLVIHPLVVVAFFSFLAATLIGWSGAKSQGSEPKDPEYSRDQAIIIAWDRWSKSGKSGHEPQNFKVNVTDKGLSWEVEFAPTPRWLKRNQSAQIEFHSAKTLTSRTTVRKDNGKVVKAVIL